MVAASTGDGRKANGERRLGAGERGGVGGGQSKEGSDRKGEREQWWRGVVRGVVECGGSQQWFAFVDCASSVVCGCGVWGVRTAGVWCRVRRAVRGLG